MYSYQIRHSVSMPSSEIFMLHSHNNYELLYFLSGDCDYIVEGAVYPLEPNSIMLIRPAEMHRIFHKSNTLYERIVFNLEESFFEEMQCSEYTNIFKNRSSGTKNKIRADVVEKSGISRCYERLEKYSGGFNNLSLPVIRSVIVEILHILNNSDINDSPSTNRIQKVISYINTSFQENITLSSIADKFFVSKSHLAREFHCATGYTVQGYLNRRRLTEAISLRRKGESLGEASSKAGFSDYTSFYRTFSKEFNCSPKDYFKQATII